MQPGTYSDGNRGNCCYWARVHGGLGVAPGVIFVIFVFFVIFVIFVSFVILVFRPKLTAMRAWTGWSRNWLKPGARSISTQKSEGARYFF
jgi:hypothetical protein